MTTGGPVNGYAVVDLETTGLHPGRNERVVEVAVVHVSPHGTITGSWETLLNPGRDLGPQHIHGIRAAEIMHAPTFEQIVGELAALLRGRVMVAHNLRFDAGFLATEYLRCGYQVPIAVEHGLCTMGLAHRYLPGSGRSLADCCAAFGIAIVNAHRASADAVAAAELLIGYLGLDPHAGHWSDGIMRAASLVWPPMASSGTTWLPREQARRPERHFLTRLVERLPDPGLPDQHAAYLAMLDQALLDRHISLTESDGLVAVAAELGMGRSAAQELHVHYVRQLVQVAWADGVITEAEHGDLFSVGVLLGLGGGEVDRLLAESRPIPGSAAETASPTVLGGCALRPGDLIVFTGEMSRLRSEWEEDAAQAGLVPHPAITKKVALLVAADPDSLSGKARKARDYGIPVVTEDGFARLLAQYQRFEGRQVPVATSTSLLDCGSR